MRYPFRASRDRALLSAILGVLLIALLWLGILLYRWSIQITELTRVRIGVGLQSMMTNWQLELYRRMSEMPVALQVGPDSGAHDDWRDYCERYQRREQQVSDPGLVKDVFLYETSSGKNPRLLRFDPTQRALSAIPSPAPLKPLLRLLQQNSGSLPRALQIWHLSATQPGEQFFPASAAYDAAVTGWQFVPEIPAVVHPIIHHSLPGEVRGEHDQSFPDWIVITYDWANISTELIPHITQEYFGNPEGLQFKIAVLRVPGQSLGTVIYSSDTDFGIHSRDDASMNIFGPAPKTVESRALQPQRQSRAIVEPDWENLPGLIWFPIIQTTPGDSEQWELRVAHRRDSLASLILGFRRRNLLLGLSILAVLSLVMLVVLIAAYRAHTLSQLQMQFVASISHELRTPLAVLSSTSENLADGIVRDPSRIAQYRGIMAKQIRHLSHLVDQVLRFAATEHRLQPARSAVDVALILQEVLADLEGLIQQSQITVHNSVSPHLPKVMGDASVLSQCLQNLLTNSIKYSGSGRWVGIDAKVSDNALRAAQRLQLTVRDHGIGIPSSELPHIFKPFYRGPTVTASNTHGTGLGLSITKNLIEAIGGRITVESSPGKGSAFTLHLEVASQVASHTAPSGSNS